MAISLEVALKDACTQILDTSTLVRVVLSGRRRNMQTEFERLFEIDKKKRLTNLANPVEHAVLSHLCVLKEGNILDFFL